MIASPVSRACLVCGAPLSLALDGREARVCRRVDCQWTFRTTPAHRACSVCRRPLSSREVVDACCADPACRRVRAEVIKREHAEQLRLRRAEQAADAATLRDLRGPAFGIADHGDYIPTPVPGLKRRVTRISNKRRASVRAHVASLIAKVRAGEFDVATHIDASGLPGTTPDPAPAMAPELASILGKSCGRCRGRCCSYGGNHAYLRVDAVARYMAANPDRGPEQVLDDYMARIDARTFHESCAYHGEQGCTLPREMRSNICNSFYCYGLAELRKTVEAGAAPRAFVFTVGGGGAMTAAFVDAKDVRVVRRRAASPTA